MSLSQHAPNYVTAGQEPSMRINKANLAMKQQQLFTSVGKGTASYKTSNQAMAPV